MSPNETEHSGIWSINQSLKIDAVDPETTEATSISAEIIRFLPLLAANDFLDEDHLPPVA